MHCIYNVVVVVVVGVVEINFNSIQYSRAKMNEHLLVGCLPVTVGVVKDNGWTDICAVVESVLKLSNRRLPNTSYSLLTDISATSHSKQRNAPGRMASNSSPFHQTLLIDSSRSTSATSDRSRSTTDRHATIG